MGRSLRPRQEEMGRPWCLGSRRGEAIAPATHREPGPLGFSARPYLYLVNGFLIFFLPGFEQGLSIFNHLLQTVFRLLERKGKQGEARWEGWDGAPQGKARERVSQVKGSRRERGRGQRTREKQVTEGGHKGKTEHGVDGGRGGDGLAPGEEEPGPCGREGGYLSRGLCSSQGIAREVLPEQQGLLGLLPSQAVTVVLKIILPPRDREPRRQGGRQGGAAGRGSGLGGGAARGLRDSQLVQHALHLLVDAEGRALLLVPVGVAGPVTL